MSVKLMGMVFEAGPADGTERFVLLALADNCDDTGFAYPGVALLASKSCQSERNVLRILEALEVAGWLAIKRRSWGPKKRGNSYQLNMARLKKAAGRAAENPAEESNLSPYDRVSPDVLQDADSIAQAEAPSDTVSCSQLPVQIDSRGDKQGVHEVTKTTSRGDKTAFPILKNHQEPSGRTIPPVVPRAAGDVWPKMDLKALERGAGEVQRLPSQDEDRAEAVAKVQRECRFAGPRMAKLIGMAMELERERNDTPESWNGIAERMLASHARLLACAEDFLYPVGATRFFRDGLWADDRKWPWDAKALRNSQPHKGATIGMNRDAGSWAAESDASWRAYEEEKNRLSKTS